MGTNGKSLKYYFMIISIYLGILWSWLQYSVADFFSYWDELLAVFLGVYILFRFDGIIRINKKFCKIYIPILGYILVGILSNIIYKYTTLNVAIQDAFLNIKYLLVLFGYIYIYRNVDIDPYKRNILLHLKLITVFLATLFLIDKIWKIFPVYEVRFGIPSEQLFFSHPTFASGAYCFILILFLAFSDKKLKKSNLMYCIILLALNFFTLRFKAISISIFIVAVYLVVYYSIFRKIKWMCIALGVIGVALIAYDQVYFYFFSNKALLMPRGAMLQTSLKILIDFFPIGTGFATFGSYMSGVYYSEVYKLYKLNNIYGMTADNFNAITDNYWPMVMGQTGFLGLMFQIMCWIGIYKYATLFKSKKDSYYIAALSVVIFLLVSSTSESAIVNPIGVAMAIVLGLIFSQINFINKDFGKE